MRSLYTARYDRDMSRIDSIAGNRGPLRAEAVLLCTSYRTEGEHLVISSPFVADAVGQLRPYHLLAILSGEAGEYALAVEIVAHDGHRWMNRGDPHHRPDRYRLTYYWASFNETVVRPGRIEYRLLCNGHVIGSTTLTVV